MNKIIVLMFMSFWMLFSCGSRKEMVYMQPDSSNPETTFEQYIPKIQPQDILTISVTSGDPKATIPFNPLSPNTTGALNSSVDLALRPTYTVDQDGFINFPLLGKVKIGGFTRLQAIELLREKLETYIKQPTVNMNFNNFRITVLGEVNQPGSFILPTERVSILDAVGMAGDLNVRGLRNNIMIVREIDGKKTVGRIDLTQQSALNSPYYYLVQNDVIYVEPNKTQINNAKVGNNTSIFISVAGLLVTIISVLTR